MCQLFHIMVVNVGSAGVQVDSLENISHSLCTLEFESRRTSYYWLLEVRVPSYCKFC